MTHPGILLLDEPFAALDPATRVALQEWLLALIRRRQLTALLVTHDIEEAIFLGDRIGLLVEGSSGLRRIWRNPYAGQRADAAGIGALRHEILAHYRTPTSSHRHVQPAISSVGAVSGGLS